MQCSEPQLIRSRSRAARAAPARTRRPSPRSSSRVARASASSITEIANPTWIRTQSPGPMSSKSPMLTVRRTPATSTRASWLDSSTTSTIWPGMARHTSSRSPLGGPGAGRDRVVSLPNLGPATFPGLKRPFGSNADLIARIIAIAAGPCSSSRNADLAVADAVLAGAGSLSGDRAPHQAVVEVDGALQLVRVVRVDEDREVEVAVADVADDRGDQAGGVEVALGLGDRLGEPGDRDAGVGGEALRCRVAARGRPRRRRGGRATARGARPRPRPSRSRGRRGPRRSPSTSSAWALVSAGVPWNSRKSVGRDLEVEVEVAVDGVDLDVVERARCGRPGSRGRAPR